MVEANLYIDRNFNNRSHGLKLAGIFPDHLVIQIAEMLCMHADNECVGQLFLRRKITTVLARIVMNIEYGIAEGLPEK